MHVNRISQQVSVFLDVLDLAFRLHGRYRSLTIPFHRTRFCTCGSSSFYLYPAFADLLVRHTYDPFIFKMLTFEINIYLGFYIIASTMKPYRDFSILVLTSLLVHPYVSTIRPIYLNDFTSARSFLYIVIGLLFFLLMFIILVFFLVHT